MPVYFIRAAESGHTKIGVATNLAKRLAGLQTASREQLSIIRALDGGAGLEKNIHSDLRAHRVLGEWFDIPLDLIIGSDWGAPDVPIPPPPRRRGVTLRAAEHAPPLNPAALRAWRDTRGLSAREAAAVLGVSPRTLEGLEQGRSPTSPLWGVLARLIEVMDRDSV